MTYESIVRQMRCPAKFWKILNDMFRAVSEAAIDEKLSVLHSTKLQKGEKFIKYPSQIIEAIITLDIAGQTISKIEEKRALLRGPRSEFDVTEESIMLAESSYQEAISMLVVRGMRLKQWEKIVEKVMTVQNPGTKIFCMCYICGKQGHVAKVCRSVLPHKGARRATSRNAHKCYSCGKTSHIARHYTNKNNEEQYENSTAMLVMSTIENECVNIVNRQHSIVLYSTDKIRSFTKRALDSSCTRHP